MALSSFIKRWLSFKVTGKQYGWTINDVLFSLPSDMTEYTTLQQSKISFGFLVLRLICSG